MSNYKMKVGLRQPVLKSPLSHAGFGRLDARRPESSHDPNSPTICRDLVEQEAPTTHQVSEVDSPGINFSKGNSEMKSKELAIKHMNNPMKTCESIAGPAV